MTIVVTSNERLIEQVYDNVCIVGLYRGSRFELLYIRGRDFRGGGFQ